MAHGANQLENTPASSSQPKAVPTKPETAPVPEPLQSPAEEIANALSHGIGLAAILAASPLLIGAAIRDGGTILGTTLFAASAALLYASSMLYHACPPRRKGFFRMLDHIAIYCLIAGTYSPFALGPLRGPFGWFIFGTAWSLALLGALFKTFARFRFPYVSTALYIGMGWLAVFLIRPLSTHMPTTGLAWMVAGGLAYTGGTLFYHREKMRFSHLIWHLFVLAGTACHFMAVLRYAT